MYAMNTLLAAAQTAQRNRPDSDDDRAIMAARLMALAERLHYCRLLVPHIPPNIDAWQHFVESASIEQLQEAVEHAEHYYKNLVYLDELDQGMRKEACERKVS